jgi:hypothetical protein
MSAFYPTLTQSFSIHYQAGFQSGKSTTDQLFAMRQILERCNEFNITTHHLFIDFKASYDTTIRNEVYVGMSELNFPTKLICLIKTTLTIVTCCGKIQNDITDKSPRQGPPAGIADKRTRQGLPAGITDKSPRQEPPAGITDKSPQLAGATSRHNH